MLEILGDLVGIFALTWGNIVMIVVGSVFIFLGIKYKMEPLLLVPIGFSAIIVNLALSGITEAPRGFLYTNT
jgi:Na+-transporting methylmalonyl-CoA/oxaloacetate decarboxylase beta subunit